MRLVKRTEKLSTIPNAGPPLPQLKLMAGTLVVATGLPESPVLLKTSIRQPEVEMETGVGVVVAIGGASVGVGVGADELITTTSLSEPFTSTKRASTHPCCPSAQVNCSQLLDWLRPVTSQACRSTTWPS